MFGMAERDLCSGCGVCAAVCREDAIQMIMDREGFRYPVLDLERCIRCRQWSGLQYLLGCQGQGGGGSPLELLWGNIPSVGVTNYRGRWCSIWCISSGGWHGNTHKNQPSGGDSPDRQNEICTKPIVPGMDRYPAPPGGWKAGAVLRYTMPGSSTVVLPAKGTAEPDFSGSDLLWCSISRNLGELC